ncbi:hypothetical protein LMA04_00555 [Pseudescherichia vulneris]|uniref:hypothetical protein n=1 Tax=Pseudescherichia vulneris TaxID=566 RepID=UPI00227ADEE5|nr:hypothetical protein [Pseudescherichia vulneris]WAH52585.1 hypothetical protein LMA04_00555 [Pseudescherichia vulneris]
MADVKIYTITSDDLSPPIKGEGFCTDMVRHSDYAALEAERDQLAAENLAARDREQKIIQIINNADNNYCMCGEAMETHGHGGCGHPTGMFDYHYGKWLESLPETYSTDAWQREQMAKGVDAFGRYHNFSEKRFIQKEAQKFSAQLRNGEAV